ncbi:hypothetical protein AX15_006503 [Amanita polypyramis BW_CC]|nr:hypothetical protein AX15_006503 [Amanita polypyramis BW_CC]
MKDTNVNSDTLASASFPLPFRVIVLVGFGILGWATNVHGLHVFNVDVVAAMDLRSEEHPPKPSSWNSYRRFITPSYQPIYALSAVYFLWFFMTWSMYSLGAHGDPEATDAFKYIASTAILVIIGVLICPFRLMFKRERDQFLHTLYRCLFPDTSRPVVFADIVFADICTSFAKVLGDCWLSFWMLLPGNSLLAPPHSSGWKQWILPSVMSLPYLVRFRQCMVEYFLSSNENYRPLFNALKYATSFPVIFLSAAQRVVPLELEQEKGDQVFKYPWHGAHHTFSLWLLLAAINSLYSFWWDVTYDWGLNLLKPKGRDSLTNKSPPFRPLIPSKIRHNPRDTTTVGTNTNVREYLKPRLQGLRPMLLYPVFIYPLLILINFILRMTWSIKLSSHLHLKSDDSYMIFFVEVAEVVRRWLWVFVRVEWEVIRKVQEGSFKVEDEYEIGLSSPNDIDVTI